MIETDIDMLGHAALNVWNSDPTAPYSALIDLDRPGDGRRSVVSAGRLHERYLQCHGGDVPPEDIEFIQTVSNMYRGSSRAEDKKQILSSQLPIRIKAKANTNSYLFCTPCDCEDISASASDLKGAPDTLASDINKTTVAVKAIRCRIRKRARGVLDSDQAEMIKNVRNFCISFNRLAYIARVKHYVRKDSRFAVFLKEQLVRRCHEDSKLSTSVCKFMRCVGIRRHKDVSMIMTGILCLTPHMWSRSMKLLNKLRTYFNYVFTQMFIDMGLRMIDLFEPAYHPYIAKTETQLRNGNVSDFMILNADSPLTIAKIRMARAERPSTRTRKAISATQASSSHANFVPNLAAITTPSPFRSPNKTMSNTSPIRKRHAQEWPNEASFLEPPVPTKRGCHCGCVHGKNQFREKRAVSQIMENTGTIQAFDQIEYERRLAATTRTLFPTDWLIPSNGRSHLLHRRREVKIVQTVKITPKKETASPVKTPPKKSSSPKKHQSRRKSSPRKSAPDTAMTESTADRFSQQMLSTTLSPPAISRTLSPVPEEPDSVNDAGKNSAITDQMLNANTALEDTVPMGTSDSRPEIHPSQHPETRCHAIDVSSHLKSGQDISPRITPSYMDEDGYHTDERPDLSPIRNDVFCSGTVTLSPYNGWDDDNDANETDLNIHVPSLSLYSTTYSDSLTTRTC